MEKFGYTLNPSSRIDLDNADKETFARLVQMEPDARKCMACGSCTATCTATNASGNIYSCNEGSTHSTMHSCSTSTSTSTTSTSTSTPTAFTAGAFSPTSLRSAILALQNGKPEQALESLKRCLLCGKCTMVCPRGINTRHLILAINAIYQNN